MRKKVVAGNWKMNNTLEDTKQLIKELKKELFDFGFIIGCIVAFYQGKTVPIWSCDIDH